MSNQNSTQLPMDLGYYVEFLEGNEKGRKIPVTKKRIILGRKSGDILVRDIRVSSSHLAIEFSANTICITDLGSSNGTFVEGKAVTQLTIELNKAIQIGQSLLVIKKNPVLSAHLTQNHNIKSSTQTGLSGLLDEDFVKYQANTEVQRNILKNIRPEERIVRMRVILGPDKGQKFAVQKISFFIGRVGCDISLNDPDISRKHAILELVEGGRLIIRDLASSNGTYVNQDRISNKILNPHDKIQIGKTILLFESAKAD